jgi:hypothetical protein
MRVAKSNFLLFFFFLINKITPTTRARIAKRGKQEITLISVSGFDAHHRNIPAHHAKPIQEVHNEMEKRKGVDLQTNKEM